MPERLRPSPRGRWRRPARSRREAKGGGPPLRRVSAVGHVAPSAVCPQRPRGVVSRVPPPAACPPWWCVVSAVSPAMESAQPDVSLSAMSPRQPYPPVNLIPLSAMSPNQPCPPPSSTISPVSHVHLLAISPISRLPHQPVPSVSHLPHQPYSASARPPCQPHHQLPARSVSAISCAPLSVMSPHQCCPPLPAVYPSSCPVSNIMSPSASSP